MKIQSILVATDFSECLRRRLPNRGPTIPDFPGETDPPPRHQHEAGQSYGRCLGHEQDKLIILLLRERAQQSCLRVFETLASAGVEVETMVAGWACLLEIFVINARELAVGPGCPGGLWHPSAGAHGGSLWVHRRKSGAPAALPGALRPLAGNACTGPA